MSEHGPIYLDYNATTPADPAVVEAMMPMFSDTFANPASRTHDAGRAAADAVAVARGRVASLLNTRPDRLVFTAGASESINLAIKGYVRGLGRTGTAPRAGSAAGLRKRGGHVVTAAHEHAAVLESCRLLEREGVAVTYLSPGRDGIVTPRQVADALREDTVLVSIMWANNELGTVQDVPAIAALCRSRGVVLHTDATQWVGKMPTDLATIAVDMLSCSAHKFYGPKGAGALYLRDPEALGLEPIINGGGHEDGLRSGTLNVPAIVGMGVAAELAGQRLVEDASRLGALRDRLEAAMLNRLPKAGVQTAVNGSPEHRLPQTTNLTLSGVDPELLLTALGAGVAVSSGSACGSGSLAPSHVLAAIGHDTHAMDTLSLRISLGRPTTASDVDQAVEAIVEAAAVAADGGAPIGS